MAPQNDRRAPVRPVTAAQLERLARTLDRIGDALEAHASIVEANRRDFVLQFQRIAQLQAQLDRLTQTVTKLTPTAA